jgi:cell division protease FtsH
MGIYLALFAVVLLVAYFYQGNMPEDAATVKEVPLSEFIQHLENEEIKEINQTETKLTGKLDEKTTVYAYVNSSIELMTIWDTYVYPQMLEGKIETVESDPPDTGSVFLNLLPTIVMVLALGFLFMSGELLKKRSLWMTVAFASVLLCTIVSLVCNFPGPK